MKFIYVLIVSISILFSMATLAICIVKEQEIREAQRTQSFGIPESQTTCAMLKNYQGTVYKRDGAVYYYPREWRF